MADVVCREKRSSMMSGIKGKDTNPEKKIRSGLHKRGLRFRLHTKDLPGRPDIKLKAYNALIFINGCFWHHHNCHLFKMPNTRKEFWAEKLLKNVQRDKKNVNLLLKGGWRILIIWECALKGKERIEMEALMVLTEEWIRSGNNFEEIRGTI